MYGSPISIPLYSAKDSKQPLYYYILSNPDLFFDSMLYIDYSYGYKKDILKEYNDVIPPLLLDSMGKLNTRYNHSIANTKTLTGVIEEDWGEDKVEITGSDILIFFNDWYVDGIHGFKERFIGDKWEDLMDPKTGKSTGMSVPVYPQENARSMQVFHYLFQLYKNNGLLYTDDDDLPFIEGTVIFKTGRRIETIGEGKGRIPVFENLYTGKIESFEWSEGDTPFSWNISFVFQGNKHEILR